MIGKIVIGKSFRGCISYCLEDKKQDHKNELMVKNRAEVLSYNLCYGNKWELIRQFNEVRNLNLKLSKPVMHITLSLAPGEELSKGKLSSLVEDCATDLGFDKNQYIAIHHTDTRHQHIHIVVNRVGFDVRTVRDNHNYQKIAAYCRKMELKHGLKQVLSPRKFMSKELRVIPRLDKRKESLRQHIRECLTLCNNYPDFERMIKQRGYEIIKARGISFLDKQKVKVKGSELGYSLQTIEKLIALEPKLRTHVLQQKEQKRLQQLSKYLPHMQQKQSFLEKHRQSIRITASAQKPNHLKKELLQQQQHFSKETQALENLLKAEIGNNTVDSHLLKTKKRKRQSPHL